MTKLKLLSKFITGRTYGMYTIGDIKPLDDIPYVSNIIIYRQYIDEDTYYLNKMKSDIERLTNIIDVGHLFILTFKDI